MFTLSYQVMCWFWFHLKWAKIMDFMLKQKVLMLHFAHIDHRATMHYALRQTTLYERSHYN